MKKLDVVAIDGPSGAGKSTAGKLVAKKLSYIYVDTGAMYRAVALKALRKGISYDDKDNIEKMLGDTLIEFVQNPDKLTILLDGEDVTAEIRTEKMGMEASKISMKDYVRKWMKLKQREMGEKGKAVFDGRDMGTVIFPDALYKFFLSADPEERARRRFKELREKKLNVRFQDILEEIKKRDQQDSQRSIAPLKKAEDAILIDTTTKSIEEVVSIILSHIEEIRGKRI